MNTYFNSDTASYMLFFIVILESQECDSHLIHANCVSWCSEYVIKVLDSMLLT